MSDIVIHRREFSLTSRVLEFDSAVEIFKIIHIGLNNENPTVHYETLENPIYKQPIKLQLVLDNEYIPDRGIHVGSVASKHGNYYMHVYQILERK